MLEDGRAFVSAVAPEGAAGLAGVEAGDELLAVDTHTVRGLSTPEIVQLVRGTPMSPVVLHVRPPGVA